MSKSVTKSMLAEWLADNDGKSNVHLPNNIKGRVLARKTVFTYLNSGFGKTANDWAKSRLKDALNNGTDFPVIRAKNAYTKKLFKDNTDTDVAVSHIGSAMIGQVAQALKMKPTGKKKMKTGSKEKAHRNEVDVDAYPSAKVRYANGMIVIFNPADKAKVDKIFPLSSR